MSKPLIDIEGILLSAIEKMPKETETIDVCENMVFLAVAQAQFLGMDKMGFLEAVESTWDYLNENGPQEYHYLDAEVH